jgi:hypothetical protein
MQLTSGLGEPVSFDALPGPSQAQYALVSLLDAFFIEGNFRPVTLYGKDKRITSVELIPVNQDGYALKSKITQEIAQLTAPVRSEQALADFQILKESGYHLRINKVSLDEWRIAVDHRLGTLSCSFIDA